jgi:hypothetical protein
MANVNGTLISGYGTAGIYMHMYCTFNISVTYILDTAHRFSESLTKLPILDHPMHSGGKGKREMGDPTLMDPLVRGIPYPCCEEAKIPKRRNRLH